MFKAEEARRKTLLNTRLKSIMKDIEASINKSIERGWFDASVSFSDNLDKDLLDVLIKELESLGYAVEYVPAKPLPPGCRSDQWNYNSYLKINWESEE